MRSISQLVATVIAYYQYNVQRSTFPPSTTMSFTYVKIPASEDSPIEELTASKAGGLEKDELVKQAREYFQAQSNGEHPSCDIMALSIPVPGNDYRAVSLYSSDYQESLLENKRATSLVTACGHSLVSPIRGDVFVGRAYDNEEVAWERDNFLKEDAIPTAEWCRKARIKGGGGGQGGNVSTLNNLVKQQMKVGNAATPPQLIAPQQNLGLYGMDGAPPAEEKWGTWTQTSEEIELKLALPENCKSKDCNITFQRMQISVAIQNDIKLKGTLFAPVIPDDCTYTLESTKNGSKELCITLTKVDEGTTWSFVTDESI